MIKNILELSCENCGMPIVAIVECDDGICTYHRCATCGYIHGCGSNYDCSVSLKLEDMHNEQAEYETQQSLLGGI